MTIVDSAVVLVPQDGRLDEAHAVARAVAAPGGRFAAVDNEAGNRHVLDLCRRRPERFAGLAVANPWYGARAVRGLEAAFAAGLVGLFLDPPRQGFRLTEAQVDPLIEVCRRYRRPVYAHVGTPVCAMPFQLAELARRFPDVTFIMGHQGWPDFCGYDDVPAARQAANVLLETSCAFSGSVQAAFDALGPQRLLFGSGYPRSDLGVELAKLRRLGLAPEHERMVLGGNALRVWGIEP